MELFDIEKWQELYTCGIFTDKPIAPHKTPEDMVYDAYKVTRKHLLAGKYCMTLGGEHSVSIGPIKAYQELTENLTILQLDAHGDLREEYEESMNNHACVMARAREKSPIVQVGIRSICIEESETIDKSRVFFAHDIWDNDAWMDKAISLLTEKVYITIDLDVFDPAEVPATGTPEPGGLKWYQVIRFLEKVHAARNVVGSDVVELCPNDHSKPSEFLAAKLTYKLIGMKFFK
jgi:agmatinase